MRQIAWRRKIVCVVPFVLINFATLMLISYVPAISLLLVDWGR
jgi:TRAP-type C4-dicarboxylate transport system permease large subunit